MLSVGTRDGGGKRVGIGFGRRVEMEENELEEGEACSDQEGDPTIDPDIALSYIDEKIQHVLGQYQKDFEGGVCAQNLGAKFGDYGSFLPAYQRSPSILSQPRSPNKGTNSGVSRFPNTTQPEAVCQSKNSVTNSSETLRNKCVSTSTQAFNSNPNKPLDHASTVQHEPDSRSLNGKNSKSFKFRIKVGSENAQSRSNAALYSGLGLDMSPSSSSFEDSPDVNEDLPHRFHDSPSVSPHSTYKLYSRFQVSNIVVRLLSPIPETMLHLVDKKTQHQKQVSEEKIPLRNGDTYLGKSRKPTGRIGVSALPSPSEVNNINPKVGGSNRNVLSENSVTDLSKKEITLTSYSGLKCAAEKSVGASDGEKASVSSTQQRPEKSVHKGRGGVSSEPVSGKPSGNLVEDKSVKPAILQFPSNNELVIDSFPVVKHDSYDIKKNLTDQPYGKQASATVTDEGYKGVGNESSKLKLRHSDSSEQGVGRSFEGKLKSSGGKRKNKESGSDISLPLKSVKGTSDAVSVLASKEKKKSVCAKGDRVKSQHNAMRPPKENDRSVTREGRNMIKSHFKEDERGGDRVESAGDGIKHGYRDAHVQPAQTEHPKDKITCNMVESMPSLADKSTLVNAAVSNIPSLEPVQHIDEWVCCDKCQKWRLLPFGATTAKFPQNWMCSMLDWLPGMNKCSVSEEDTTKACKALYEPHPTDGHVALMGVHAAQSTTHADSQYRQHGGNFLASGVAKKNPVKDAAELPGQPPTAVSAIHIKPRPQTSLRNKIPNDVKLSIVDSAVLIKPDALLLSKTYDYTENHSLKQKEKDRSLDQYSDGGDSLEKSHKRSKSKSTGEAGFRTSKKVKLKESNYDDENSHSFHSIECKAVDDTSYSRKMSSKIHEENSFSSASELDARDNSKKIAIVRSAERVKENVYMSDQDKPGIPLKRKSLELEENGAPFEAEFQEEASETIRRKDKKYKLSKFEGRELSVGEVGSKADKGRNFPLSFKIDQSTNGVEKLGDFNQVDQHGQKNTDDLGNLKKESVRSQPSAATSSSSKVSGSCKSKTRFSETRGSPVESVSSSPLRTYAIDKLSTRKNKQRSGNIVELDSSLMLSPQRGSDGKVNGKHGEFGTKLKLKTRDTLHSRSIETTRSAGSRPLDPAYHSQGNKIGNDSTGKAADSLYAKLFGCTDDEPSPSRCENIDMGADAVISSEQPDSNALPHVNGHCHEQEEPAACLHHVHQSEYQRKSGKISSSQTTAKYINSMSNHRGKMEMTTQRTSSLVVDDNQPVSGLHLTSHVVCTDLDDTRDDTLNAGKEFNKSSVKISGNSDYEGKRDNPTNSSAVVIKGATVSHLQTSKSKNLSAKICQSTTITRKGEEYQKDENCQPNNSKVDNRDSNRLLTERIDKPSRGRSEQLPKIKDKRRESHDHALLSMQVCTKDGKSDGNFAEDVKGRSEKLLKQVKKIENQSDITTNGLDTYNGCRKSPILSATNVIREARDLKHMANRKKNEGLENESTPLYFQAALKFLHGASLLELSNNDSSRLGEKTSSIQMYSETAKLCEFCAHEYEKQKELAAAALAYKCMEVAYMKVVYSKHPLAIKDRQELQAAPRIGESPSSSASDVDNVNNQSNADRMTSDKINNSAQVAGTHVIAARNRPNFVRMLSFAEIVNFAMDASRRSNMAFASASIRNETDKDVESLLSVRRVLDFSFHDIEGLLRLVRLSMEYISR